MEYIYRVVLYFNKLKFSKCYLKNLIILTFKFLYSVIIDIFFEAIQYATLYRKLRYKREKKAEGILD